MIAPIDPRAYDCEGRVTLLPRKGSLNFRPTLSMATYVTCKCSIECDSLKEIRRFLRGCRYSSDYEQYGVRDYWMRPDEFEARRQGDCEDFSLWAWRQLLGMGLAARFVLGRVGYGRQLHAWVTFSRDDRHYLLEAVSARRRKLSQLSVMMHEPELSVAWEQGRLVYRQHEPRDYRPSPGEILRLVAEWLPLSLARFGLAFVSLPWRLGRMARAAWARPEDVPRDT